METLLMPPAAPPASLSSVLAYTLPAEMLRAITSDNWQRARQALDAGLDCDHRYRCGSVTRSGASLCAERGRLQILELLVQRQASVEQADSDGTSPLHRAAAQGHIALVRLILQHGHHAHGARDAELRTPLHCAAEQGHSEAVELLLDAGAELDARDRAGFTPLMWACHRGRLAVARLLLSRGASASPQSSAEETALHLLSRQSARAADLALVAALLAASAGTEAGCRAGRTPLQLALTVGHSGTAETLLRAGAELGADGAALQMAVRTGSASLVRLLLLRGARSDHDTLFQAARSAPDVLDLLLWAGARPPPPPLRPWPPLEEDCSAARATLVAAVGTVPELTVCCRRALLALRLVRPEQTVARLPLPAPLAEFLLFGASGDSENCGDN